MRRHAARVYKAHQPLLSPRRSRARARLSTEEKLLARNLSEDAAGHRRGARLIGLTPKPPRLSCFCSALALTVKVRACLEASKSEAPHVEVTWSVVVVQT